MLSVFKESPISELSKSLAATNSAEEIHDFLHSLLTDAEFKAVSDRWALVRLIESGMSQRKIAEELGLSLCKITRGSKELKKEDSSFRRMVDRYKALT